MCSYQSTAVQCSHQSTRFVSRQQRDTPLQREQRRVQDGRARLLVEGKEGAELVLGSQEPCQWSAHTGCPLLGHVPLEQAQQGSCRALQHGVQRGGDDFLRGAPPTSSQGEIYPVGQAVVQDGSGHLPLEQSQGVLQWEWLEQTGQCEAGAGGISEVVPDHGQVPILWRACDSHAQHSPNPLKGHVVVV